MVSKLLFYLRLQDESELLSRTTEEKLDHRDTLGLGTTLGAEFKSNKLR